MKKIEAAEMIEKISEEMCIEHLGYTPSTWYTGGPDHNDDRLVARIKDGKIIVTDGNAIEEYMDRRSEDAIRDFVSDWLHTLWVE
jgi:hypothetical protein